MLFRSAAFNDYVAKAGEGKTALWRLLVGTVLVLALWLILQAAVFFTGLVMMIVTANVVGFELQITPSSEFFLWFITQTRLGLATLLVSVATLWIAVRLVVRFVHRRSIRRIIKLDAAFFGPEFRLGLSVSVVVGFALTASLLGFDTPSPNQISLYAWLLAALPLAALIFFQATAEEVFFRGYLLQSLAYRFASPIMWGLSPALVFTLVHWNPEALPWMNAAVLTNIGAFAIATTILTYWTGNLAAASGAHLGNNFLAFLIFAPGDDNSSASLFVGRAISDPSWTVSEAVVLGLAAMLATSLTLVLLLHERSPVRLPPEASSPRIPASRK